MDKEEIERYVELGRYANVYVDVRLMPEYPGIVRSVIFYRDNCVCIQFDGHGSDEGYEYCCTFSSLSDAVEAIEDYLAKPISDWTNHNKTGDYPDLPDDIDFNEGCIKLASDMLTNSVHLPRKGDFKLRGELGYNSLDEYKAAIGLNE